MFRPFGPNPERNFLMVLRLCRLPEAQFSLFWEIPASGRPRAEKFQVDGVSPIRNSDSPFFYSCPGLYGVAESCPSTEGSSPRQSPSLRCDARAVEEVPGHLLAAGLAAAAHRLHPGPPKWGQLQRGLDRAESPMERGRVLDASPISAPPSQGAAFGLIANPV